LGAKIAHLPEDEGTPPISTDEDGVIALLREDFLGGAKEAASAADAFLRTCSIKEIERGALWGMTDASYYLPLLQECLPCMPRLCSCIAAPERGGPLP
jgi:hypothetical protein